MAIFLVQRCISDVWRGAEPLTAPETQSTLGFKSVLNAIGEMLESIAKMGQMNLFLNAKEIDLRLHPTLDRVQGILSEH